MKPFVSDALWERIQPLLPSNRKRRFRFPGRKPIDDRKTLFGILFVLKTGIAWDALGRLRLRLRENLPSLLAGPARCRGLDQAAGLAFGRTQYRKQNPVIPRACKGIELIRKQIPV